MFKQVFLKPKEEKRLVKGHLWGFSNEVDTKKTPLKDFYPGEIVHVFSSNQEFIGTAFVNPNSLIALRILTRKKITDKEELNKLIYKKIKKAFYLRENSFSLPYYRFIFAESDYLPGLIVDRYKDILVVQLNSAGMDKIKEIIIYNLKKVIPTSAIILKNDSKSRAWENLPLEIKILGQVNDQEEVLENNLKFIFPLTKGQKTGWYFDQRENRALIQTYAKKKRVLDIFSYIGSFSLNALKGEAKEVLAIDRSKEAFNYFTLNTKEYKNKAHFLLGEADSQLKELIKAKEKFDLIILDPPALIPQKTAKKQGLKAYFYFNQLALRLLNKNSFFFTASCSHHLKLEELQSIVHKASLKEKRKIKILKYCFQGPDHPVHPFMPETLYLKGLFCYVE